MVKSKEFQDWIRLETSRVTGELEEIRKKVNRLLKQTKVETRENGVWVENTSLNG